MRLDKPWQRSRLDLIVEDAARDGALLRADLFTYGACSDASDLEEVVAVRHQHRLGALEVAVVLQ